jgi:hypothetical protein
VRVADARHQAIASRGAEGAAEDIAKSGRAGLGVELVGALGERIVLLAAFALWNGRGGLRLADVIEFLDPRASEAICSLVVAVKRGAAAVDDWLAEHEVE